MSSGRFRVNEDHWAHRRSRGKRPWWTATLVLVVCLAGWVHSDAVAEEGAPASELVPGLAVELGPGEEIRVVVRPAFASIRAPHRQKVTPTPVMSGLARGTISQHLSPRCVSSTARQAM
jgi:hypothetical protein